MIVLESSSSWWIFASLCAATFLIYTALCWQACRSLSRHTDTELHNAGIRRPPVFLQGMFNAILCGCKFRGGPAAEQHLGRQALAPNILELIEEKRAMIVKATLSAGTLLVLVMFVFELVIRFESASNNAQASAHAVVLAAFVSIGVVSMILVRRPRPNLRTLLHVLLLAGVATSQFSYTSAYKLVLGRILVLISRITAGLLFGCPRFTMVLNCMLSASNVFCYVRLAQADDTVGETFGPQHVTSYCASEAYSCIITVTVTHVCDFQITGEALASVMKLALKSANVALTSMINAVSDAVVAMGDDFTFVHPAQTLDSLLMYSSVRSVDRTGLRDYLCEDGEWERVKEWLQVPVVDDVPRESIRVGMRDGVGNRLDMELFHAPVPVFVDSEVRHVVGIKDLGRSGEGDVVGVLPSDIANIVDSGQDASKTGSNSSSASDESSSSASEAENPAGSCDEGDQQNRKRAKRRPFNRKGTRPSSTKEAFAKVATARQSQRMKNYPCASPEFRETLPVVQRGTLVEAMCQWNVRLRPVHCCRYHAYVQHTTDLLKHMRRNVCIPEFLDKDNVFQCQRCGIMAADLLCTYKGKPGCQYCVVLSDKLLLKNVVSPRPREDRRPVAEAEPLDRLAL